MGNLRSSSTALLLSLATAALPAACGSGGGDTGTTGAGGSGMTTSGTTSSTGTHGGGGAHVSADHPKIYLNQQNLTRLQKAVADGEPQAKRFMGMVDDQLAGTDHYAFSAADAALAY